MAHLNKMVEKIATDLLKKAGVPDNQLREKVKKTGRGMIIASILMIVPLLIFDNFPISLKVILQLSYAALVCLGVILAFDKNEITDK